MQTSIFFIQKEKVIINDFPAVFKLAIGQTGFLGRILGQAPGAPSFTPPIVDFQIQESLLKRKYTILATYVFLLSFSNRRRFVQ